MGYAGLAQKINIKKLSIFKFISLQNCTSTYVRLRLKGGEYRRGGNSRKQ